MEVGQPDVLEQVPTTGNPMKPTSGTYGDVASTDRLKQQLQLPGGETSTPATQNTPQMAPGMPQGARMPAASAPGTVPDVLMRPTGLPDVPASTPLGGPPQVEAPQGREARIAALKSLSQSPMVSAATQEWAKEVLRMYGL